MKVNEVYKITNKITNKIYIGITNQGSNARYRHHWYESRIGEPSYIHRSMAKYKEDAFKVEVIDTADTYDELKEKEKYWIKELDSTNRSKGYNCTKGGDGTFGKLHSDATKDKIRQKALGRLVSQDTKTKMSEAKKGKCSEIQRERLANIAKSFMKKVSQFTINGELIANFNSITEAVKYTKICKDTITNHLNNPDKKFGKNTKFLWRITI